MNSLTKVILLALAVSARSADVVSDPSSDSTAELSAASFEAELDRAANDAFADTESNPRPGSSYCTYAPDYTCYKHGWPRCCLEDGGSSCPRDQPPCDTRQPNPRPGRHPTRRPTRHPSNRSTRHPTRNPTRRPSNDNRRCVDDGSPRPVRDGQRFRFNLVESDSQCTDDRGRLYQWGRFDGCGGFSECAEMCVNNVPSSLAFGGNFRGYDFDCDRGTCSCLYDANTLDGRNGGRFDRTNRNESGQGSISGITRQRNVYCGKLVGAELLEDAVAEA